MKPSANGDGPSQVSSNDGHTLHGDGTDNEKARDLELNAVPTAHLVNDIVWSFGWQAMNVTVKDRVTKSPLSILTDANGLVKAGEMIAIMGPSGSGKTTLLNTLAHRTAAAGATTHGDILTNGQAIGWQHLRHLSAYVEQEDALIGSLTVRETMDFAARLALPPYVLCYDIMVHDANQRIALSRKRSVLRESMIC
jgi:ABC-type multidrug transport system fused ATPase/permease subunit